MEERPKLPKESGPEGRHEAEFGEKIVDVYKLIHLAETLPTEIISTNSLESNKLNNYWHDQEGNWLGPSQILEETEKYDGVPDWDAIIAQHPTWKDEIEKIKKADYSHPIIIVGETYVIDGMHRLTRAWAEGIAEIAIKRFPELPDEVIIHN
jgi:hypothetical protein